ncbi:MAG: tetratricopeptide repeat protein [Anaerolineales bacterium]
MNVAALLKEAVRLIKAGDKQAGRRLLKQILKADPQNESAWLWMASGVSDNQQRIYCLEQVLKINPDHEMARRGLAHLRSQAREEETSQAEEEVPDAPRSSPGLSPGVDSDNVSRLLRTLSSM